MLFHFEGMYVTIPPHFFPPGLYFASDLWPECHVFTPLLVRLYLELRAHNHRFEVVLVPEGEERPYRAFFRNMPWLSVDFHDVEKRVSRLVG